MLAQASGEAAHLDLTIEQYLIFLGSFASVDAVLTRGAVVEHGVFAAQHVRREALLSDGAPRLVDRFGLIDWHAPRDLPAGELIRRTRSAEFGETETERTAGRGMKHDDATAVLATHLRREPACFVEAALASRS